MKVLPTITNKRIELVLKVILVIAGVILVVSFALLRQEYRQLRHLGRHHDPATSGDISSVQAWMTFDYLNRLFILPPEYLETSLGVTDPRYPRLTISEYAEIKHETKVLALTEVQNAIRLYLAGKP